MAESNDSLIQKRLRMAKLSKTRSVACFTHARYNLLLAIEDPEVLDNREVKTGRRELTSAMKAAEESMEEMISLYGELNEVDSQAEMGKELEKLLADYSMTMDAVQECLHSDKVSTVSSRSNVSDPEENSDHCSPTDVVGCSNQNVPAGNVGHDLWRQLKRVSIPVFLGDKKLYENWKASFMACVDQAPSSAEYKLLQLRQYLSGEALKSIENLGHSAASYEAAKQRLERKYGGSRRHIAAQMEEVDDFKPVRLGNARDLDKLADLLDVLVINLKEANRTDELGYGSLYFKLLKKLPEHMITNFQRWINNNQKTENVESLQVWITQESEFQMIASETVKGLAPVEVSSKPGHFNRNRKEQTFTTHTQVNQTGCPCCKEQHGVWRCLKFKNLEVPDRWQLAKDKKLCFRCLGTSHMGQSCVRSRTCGLDGCVQLHHRLLHRSRQNTTAPKVSSSHYVSPPQHTEVAQPVYPPCSAMPGGGAATFVPRDNVTMVSEGIPENHIALRTVPVILKNRGMCIQVNALLDDGSTKTYLNADVAAELGLVGQPQQVTVSVLNGQYEVFETIPVEVTVQSLDGAISQPVVALTTDKVTGCMKAVNWIERKNQWPHLRGIKFPRLGSHCSVDMLIGIDYAELHFAKSEIKGRPGEPIARLTPLGWTCVGNLFPQNSVQTHFGVLHTFFARDKVAVEESEINLSLRKFWEVEEIVQKERAVSREDQRVIEQLRESMYFDNDTYRVDIPWKEGTPMLPNNYEMAVRRLENTEKRLEHCSEVREAYQKTISQYLDKGYIHKVRETDENDSMWFLPHFSVVRPEKATTKVRIVFDASATYKGVSLNQSISQGPKLQRELFDVLLRFRKQPVALVCDIAEMYLRIKIAEADQKYFRFLWRDMNQKRPPDIYEFSRVVFGANCSPFIAQFVSQEHSRQLVSELPMAAQTVLESTYMDDCMDSVLDDHQGLELYRQLSELWKRCGMHTRKWLSNSEAVMAQIPVED